jgi:hypothetical protein
MRAVVAKLEDVDEALRDHYKEVDGVFVLDVESANGYDLLGPKFTRALETERSEKAALERKLKALDGIDPDQARKDREQVQKWTDSPPDQRAKREAEAREAELVRKHTEEIEAREGTISNQRKQLSKLMVEDAARAAIEKAKGNVGLLLPHVTGSLRLREADGGQFVTEVVTAEGTQRLSDGRGSPMSVSDLVEELRADTQYAAAFQGVSAGGGGASGGEGGGSGGGGPGKTISKSDPDLGRHLDAIAKGEMIVVDD